MFSTLSAMVSGRYRDARVLVQYDHERDPSAREADRVTLRAQVGF